MKLVKSLFIFITIIMQSCTGQTPKINGISLVASREAISQEHVDPIINVNANHVAVIPFGFIKDLNAPNIVFNRDRQWYGETKVGVEQSIRELQKNKLKIMLKPQIWVWQGKFTGYIKMDNETDWKVLENTYTQFITSFAKLAAEMNVDLLCIGTELEQFILNRPLYWSSLIKEIKTVYKGKITYAANWDEFKRIPFWNELDYIGVDAYFPVSDSKTPTLEECLTNWEPHKQIIHNVSNTHNKPILFTEFGYRSVDYSGKEPWKSDRNMTQVNLKAQSVTTQALFNTFWKEDWFVGGFVWKWYHDYENAGGENNARFTPQNKPAESIIKKQYGLK